MLFNNRYKTQFFFFISREDLELFLEVLDNLEDDSWAASLQTYYQHLEFFILIGLHRCMGLFMQALIFE